MAEKLIITKDLLVNVADAIRDKLTSADLMTLTEMPEKIASISGGDTPTGTIDITENGKYNVSKYAEANVDVPKPFTDVFETTMTDGSFEIYGGYQAYNTFNDVWYTELVDYIGIEDNTLCVEIDGNTIFANGEVRWSDYEQTTVHLPLQENTYGIYSIVSTSAHTGLATAIDGVIQELVGKDIKLKIANEIYIRDNYTVVDVKDYAFAQIKWFPNLQHKWVTPTEELQYIHADVGFDGLGNVDVEPIPPEYIIPTGTLSITENGVVDAKDYKFVDVNVSSPKKILFYDRFDSNNWDYYNGKYVILDQVEKFEIAVNNISRMFGLQTIDSSLGWTGMTNWVIKIGDWEFFPDNKVQGSDYTRFSEITATRYGLIGGHPDWPIQIHISNDGGGHIEIAVVREDGTAADVWAKENWDDGKLFEKEIYVVSNFGIERIWSFAGSTDITIEHEQMLDFEKGLMFEIKTGPTNANFSNNVIWEKRPVGFQISYPIRGSTTPNIPSRIRITTYGLAGVDNDQGNRLIYTIDKCCLVSLDSNPFTITERSPENFNMVTGVYKIL